MHKVEISPKTIVFATFFWLGLFFLFVLHELLFSLFIGFIIMSALYPVVAWLEKRKFPNLLATTLVYFGFILFFIALFALIIPPILIEVQNFVINFPTITRDMNPKVYSTLNFGAIETYLPNIVGQSFQVASGLFANAFFVITSFIFGFFLLLQAKAIRTVFTHFFDHEKSHTYTTILETVQKRMSAWFWGEILLMTAVGFLTFIGLSVIGMKYVLALAVLAGLLEIVPNLGPILGAIPALLIGFGVSPLMGWEVLALYVLVQQLENNVVVPVIMRNAVGLNPIVTLIALLVGDKLAGTLGLLLAIPVYLLIEVLVKELLIKRHLADNLR